MKSKPLVILCTDGVFPFAVGGMQRHSRLLAEHLARRGNVQLLVLHPHKESVFDPSLGIREHSIAPIDESKNYLLQCYAYSKRVADFLETCPSDAIIYAQGLTLWANIRKFTPRLIHNPHGLESFQVLERKEKMIGFPFRKIFRYIFKRSRYVVSLGGKLTTIISRQLGNKDANIAVLPNGVEPKTRELSTSRSGPVRVLFVSRFAHNKGIGTLFEAVQLLSDSKEGDNFEFHLIGKGPLYEHYLEKNTFPHVHIHGFVSDEELHLHYKDCDIFLLPTWFEGMPTVVLEAMSHGKPVIVSDVGASAELVGPENGYLLPPRDVKALVAALLDFKGKTEEARLAMGEKGYQKMAANFAWDQVAARHEDLFFKVYNELTSISPKKID
jgi:glycosyltransferase involved in cell wall biosynthesis